MSDDWKEWSNHVLLELKRLDKSNEHTHEKLEKIDDTIHTYNETLIRNTLSLEMHMKRTDLLEEKVFDVEKEVTTIKEHVDSFKSIMKIFKSIFSIKGRSFVRFAIWVGIGLASYKLGIKEWVLSFFE